MASINVSLSSRTALTLASGYTTLANGTYCLATAYTPTTLYPLDYLIEVAATCGTGSTTGFVYVFAQITIDGTNYSTGPTSGTTVTDENQLYFIGALPLTTSLGLVRKQFSLFATIGMIPKGIKIVLKNSTGVALTALTAGIVEVVSTTV